MGENLISKNREEIKRLIDKIYEITPEQIANFESWGLIKELDCITFTGFSYKQLNNLMEKYIHTLRSSKNRTMFTAVTVYLTKLDRND